MLHSNIYIPKRSTPEVDVRDAYVGNPWFEGLTQSQAQWQKILYFHFFLSYLTDTCPESWEKLGKKTMQDISESNTPQILTLCNITCKYTRIFCLVLYKLQEIVS
jgi:hypothetical protein